MNKTSSRKILLGITMSILLVLMCIVPTSAESFGTQAKIEGNYSPTTNLLLIRLYIIHHNGCK